MPPVGLEPMIPGGEDRTATMIASNITFIYGDGLRPGQQVFDSRKRKKIFSTPQRPDRLRGPTSLLYGGYWGL
jgi:hypothetical protein